MKTIFSAAWSAALFIALSFAVAAPAKTAAPAKAAAPAKSEKFAFAADPFKEGDVVCWVGDSITHGGSYHSQVQLFMQTRFPNLNVQYFNCGIGGDRASGIMGRAFYRLTNDILDHKPTVATIMLGMNDVDRGAYNDPKVTNAEARKAAALAVYETNMQALIQALQASGARVILCTPSIYDESLVQSNETRIVSKGANETLRLCAEKMKEWSKKYKTQIVDFHFRMQAVNEAWQKESPTNTVVGRDRVHPGAVGHLVMAYGFLKDTGMTPLVSRIAIDARKPAAAPETSNASIQNVKTGKDSLSFDCLEKALPFPVTDGAKAALARVPFMKDLNQQTLQVKNLAKGKWMLSIDGSNVGPFTEAQLAAGVNLAELTHTPQYQQAWSLMKSNEQRNSLAATARGLVSLEYNSIATKGVNPTTDPEKAREIVQKMIDDATKKDPKKVKGDWKLYLDAEKREKNANLEKALIEYLEKNRAPKSHAFVLTKAK
jgi:endoglucanase